MFLWKEFHMYPNPNPNPNPSPNPNPNLNHNPNGSWFMTPFAGEFKMLCIHCCYQHNKSYNLW